MKAYTNIEQTKELAEVMPNIHSSKLPQEIKDVWVRLATQTNIQYLHEGDYEQDLY